MSDRIIEKADGFYCEVGGREFGAWRTRLEACGGMEVEQRRLAARQAKARLAAREQPAPPDPDYSGFIDPNYLER